MAAFWRRAAKIRQGGWMAKNQAGLAATSLFRKWAYIRYQPCT